MKYPILDEIGAHFLDRATQLVKSGHTFVYVLDNIDWEEKAHDMRQDVQNRSVHAVATSIVFNRVPDNGLPDSGPQQSLKDCNVHQLVNINRLKLLNRSSSHTHKSSEDDEKNICRDLRGLRPFKHQDGRSFETFLGISPDPTHLLDAKLFKE